MLMQSAPRSDQIHPRAWAKGAARLAVLALALLALAVLCSGCASEPMSTLLVHVRSGPDGQPLQGAMVLAETPSRDHPFSVESLLGQTGPRSDSALTDSQGAAAVHCPRERPVRIGIITPAGVASFTLLDPHPGLTGIASDWTAADGAASVPANNPEAVEFRVEPR